MNYINYLKHVTFTPETYYRRYDIDLSQVKDEIKRIPSLVLPFVGLYKPVAPILSVGGSSLRVITHLHKALQLQSTDNRQCAIEISHATLATISIATSVFNFSLGLFITTGFDLAQGIASTNAHFREGNYDKAKEEALQVLASALYFGFMSQGALEWILLSTLAQATVSFYQANNEWEEGRKIDALLKMVMGTIHLTQANHYRQCIKRRNFLFAMQKYKSLVESAERGKAVRYLIMHPLQDLPEKIDEKKVILANQSGEYDFGSHFHGLGKGLVKGANLQFRQVTVDGHEMTELEFKINHAFRDALEKSIKDLRQINPKEAKEILQFTGSHVSAISTKILNEDHDFSWMDNPKTHELSLQNLGTIKIGASADYPTLYDRVVVQMDSSKTLYDLHELMAFTNLDSALCLSSKDDLERLKMGHLFRTFYPREATPFEVTDTFFSLPTYELKAKMIEKAPQMKELFETYLDKMTEAEILPGRVRYKIPGLAKKVYDLGGRALTAAITASYFNDAELYEKIASLLSMGLISRELKDTHDLDRYSGLGNDYFTGGVDSIFTQMIVEKNIKQKENFSSFYFSKARFLISLDALETGTYQYYEDNWGNRIRNQNYNLFFWGWDYSKRPGILEFTETLQNNSLTDPYWGWNYNRNEVMLKERLDPSYFTGMILDSEKTRNELLTYLRKKNLIQTNRLGIETILNIPIYKFFRIGQQVTEELIRPFT
jgi:hypothetical protein